MFVSTPLSDFKTGGHWSTGHYNLYNLIGLKHICIGSL